MSRHRDREVRTPVGCNADTGFNREFWSRKFSNSLRSLWYLISNRRNFLQGQLGMYRNMFEYIYQRIRKSPRVEIKTSRAIFSPRHEKAKEWRGLWSLLQIGCCITGRESSGGERLLTVVVSGSSILTSSYLKRGRYIPSRFFFHFLANSSNWMLLWGSHTTSADFSFCSVITCAQNLDRTEETSGCAHSRQVKASRATWTSYNLWSGVMAVHHPSLLTC